MQNRKRVRATLFLSLAIIGILFLSSGLPDIVLSNEWQLIDFDSTAVRRGTNSLAGQALERLPAFSASLLRLVFMSTVIILPTALVLALLSAEVRKALIDELKKILPFVIWLATLVYLLGRLQLNSNLTPGSRSAGDIGEPPDWITNPTAVLAFLVGLLLLLIVSGLGWYAVRAMRRRNRSRRLELLAREAQSTLQELSAGRNFKNAIIECYYRLCRLLSEQRRIERSQSMTPREFATRLQTLGIGGEEVQRLTSLFEVVRYGAQSLGPAEEREAVSCLTAFVGAAQQAEVAQNVDRSLNSMIAPPYRRG